MRHTQRQVLMMDPNWNRGFYYGKVPPHAGMKLAREIMKKRHNVLRELAK